MDGSEDMLHDRVLLHHLGVVCTDIELAALCRSQFAARHTVGNSMSEGHAGLTFQGVAAALDVMETLKKNLLILRARENSHAGSFGCIEPRSAML